MNLNLAGSSWRLQGNRPDGGNIDIACRMPGDNATALWESGLIPDPYCGRNEEQVQWIGTVPWIFSTTFSLPENEAWAEIPAPESVPVWVASVFVDENGVLRSGARLRCGPGTVFAEYRRGKNSFREKIVVLDKAHNGFWLRIRPIPGLKCYVSRKFLKEKPSAEKKAKPVRKTVEKQYYVTGDERPVSVEGKLVPLKKNVMDSSYELILEINGEVIPVCYLTASRLNLKLWEKRTVRINGIQRWVKGIRRPFVEIEKVSPSWK